MRIQHQNEKDDLLLQHKLDTLTNGLNIYMERLHHIDVKLSERNFACDILEYTDKLEEHKNLNDLKKDFLIYKRKIGETLTFINHIYNIIIYNKYYVGELDNCAISIVELRCELEVYATKHINDILNQKTIMLDKKIIETINNSSISLMRKYLNFQNYWTIYLQDVLFIFEKMIYINNLYELLEWFKGNNEKKALLKVKLKEINEKQKN